MYCSRTYEIKNIIIFFDISLLWFFLGHISKNDWSTSINLLIFRDIIRIDLALSKIRYLFIILRLSIRWKYLRFLPFLFWFLFLHLSFQFGRTSHFHRILILSRIILLGPKILNLVFLFMFWHADFLNLLNFDNYSDNYSWIDLVSCSWIVLHIYLLYRIAP